MTRNECERKIMEAMENIIKIYHDYNPDGKYLSLCYLDNDNDGYIQGNNRCWRFEKGEDGEDVDMPIDFSVASKKGEEAC